MHDLTCGHPGAEHGGETDISWERRATWADTMTWGADDTDTEDEKALHPTLEEAASARAGLGRATIEVAPATRANCGHDSLQVN